MTLLGFRESITTGPKDVMDIPSECIFNSLIWNTQLNQVAAIQSIFINLFFCCIWNLEAFNALLFPSARASKEDEVAEEVQNLLDQANHAPTQAGKLQATGCAAAGYTGCCTGDNCRVKSGCYCDVKCYYFHNCCDDITAIGCYRKCAIHFVCSLNHLILTVKYIIALWKKPRDFHVHLSEC